MDGAPLPSEQACVAIVADTTIAVTGIGQFRIRPAIRDRDRLLKNLQSAEDYLRATLTEAGCTDSDDAERRWVERDALEQELREARAELARLAPGYPNIGLAPGIGKLREHVDVLRRRPEEERAACGLQDLSTLPRARSPRARL